VDVFTGATVAADDNNAVGAVVPLSLTKDKDAYIGALVAFKGVCVGAFADDAGEPHKSQKWIYKTITLQIESFYCF
jgi:hypothetical protein